MTYSRFTKLVWSHYQSHGRTFPWRRRITPYRILVSEIMLQQTQTDRVVPYFNAFVRAFPSFKALSNASLQEVLVLWQGLGYNRRAKFLHQLAREVSSQYNGRLPTSEAELIALPGIGAYTAGAVRAFAYNEPSVFIETNIRTVFLHHFFKGAVQVPDKDIYPIIEKTLPEADCIREWYWALMDYGAHLKLEGYSRNRHSAHYTKQSAFKGSGREVRGAIIRELVRAERALAPEEIAHASKFSCSRVREQVNALLKESMIMKRGKKVELV